LEQLSLEIEDELGFFPLPDRIGKHVAIVGSKDCPSRFQITPLVHHSEAKSGGHVVLVKATDREKSKSHLPSPNVGSRHRQWVTLKTSTWR
jgi:hypothetical protein